MQEPMEETRWAPSAAPHRHERFGKTLTTVLLAAVVLLMAAALAINVFIAPRFKAMFEDFDAKLPAPTQFLLELSDFIRQFWFLTMMLAALVLVLAGLLTWNVDWRGGMAFALTLMVLCLVYVVGAVFCLSLPLQIIVQDVRQSP